MSDKCSISDWKDAENCGFGLRKSRFLSYGAGMQTFALLVMAKNHEIDIDEVVFADTGAEHPETYEHIKKVAKPICEQLGIPFTTVRMQKEVADISNLTGEALSVYRKMLKETEGLTRKKKVEVRKGEDLKMGVERRKVNTLRDLIIARRRVPSINPQSRWCTSDSKLIPINKGYIRVEQEKGKYIKPCTAYIGLSYEELTRMYKPHLVEYTVEYPLIDRKMTRKDCIRYVTDHGYESPPKSGCYFCPFQSEKQWGILYHKHPDLYWDAVSLEEMDLNFPTYKLNAKGVQLRKLAEYFSPTLQTTLDGELNKDSMSCEQAGYCGV